MPAGITPMQVADQIDVHADHVLGASKRLTKLELTRVNPEFRATVGDLLLMSYLGKYYAAKIRGATELALFRRDARARASEKGGGTSDARAAALVAVHRPREQPNTEIRSGPIAWASSTGSELTDEVANDIAIASLSRSRRVERAQQLGIGVAEFRALHHDLSIRRRAPR